MTKVRFLNHYGDFEREIEAEPGANLLLIAQDNGQPLEGACEGAMACSTCHVILAAEDFERLPRASEEEDDLLDLAAHVTRTSRLACQIEIPVDGVLTVRMPGAAYDWRRG